MANKFNYDLPDLIEVQKDSYRWFWEKGLRELFDETSPVRSQGGKDLELYFGEYWLEEAKFDEAEAKLHNASYEAPLYCRIKLENGNTKETSEADVFLCDFPLMTKRGTFLVNGVERVVISQVIRSSGVFFTSNWSRGEQLFGAKVIPNRGAWLEFETDRDGAINVRIDRQRKVPITALFKVFAEMEGRKIPSADEIKGFFSKINKGEKDYIEATLNKDTSKAAGDAFIEVYKRIRPGDLATEDNAKSFISAMFSFERYDLSEVGRWKLNRRLNKSENNFDKKGKEKEFSQEERLLGFDDLVDVVKEIISLNNNPLAKPDDVDHLGNRRIRTLGELLQNRLRVGLARMERIIRDRMSTLEPEEIKPGQLVNTKRFMASVKEFFTTSQLSQFMDQRNPLDELEHKRRISAMGPGGLTRERAGFEVRDVHSSHYGRICPIQTPEGPNIGLVSHLTTAARLNKYGFIETPYRKVNKGQFTNEIRFLDAYEEDKYNIAHGGVKFDDSGKIIGKEVEARVKGRPTTIKREKVDFIDVLPQQPISVATSLIPFLEHDDGNRALMGSNMQRQSVSCIKPQAPLVGTGMETRAAKDSGQITVAEEDGIVEQVDAEYIKVKIPGAKKSEDEKDLIFGDTVRESKDREKGFKKYALRNFLRTNQYTSINQRPLVKKGDKVKKGDILADGAATDKGQLSLGQNLLVAFMSLRGSNFEDAIILSEKLVKEDRFSSIHIESFTCDVRETKLGPEVTTPDIPNVGEYRLKDLDEEGIVRIGAEVDANDILVGKISPKGETELTAEERLLQAIFGDKARDVKDTSLRMAHGKRGRVVGIQIFSRDKGDKLPAGVIKSIQVEVAELRKVSVGDKLAGRHGNKGVISRILPEEDMPYLADGRPVDIVLNPLGVASRMNIGQILETHLGWAAHQMGKQINSPALAGVAAEEIRNYLEEAGLPRHGKVTLYDGRNGEAFEQEITVGYIYIMKLLHLVEDKMHMRAIGPYSLITQQPLGGKAQFGGQRFGEMEVWALEGYGAAYTLQEMLTIKSDDVAGRANAYDAIIRGRKIESENLPASFNVLVSELKSAGMGMELLKEE